MSSYNKIGAVQKSIAIMKFMAREVQPVSPTEIANAVEIPFHTVMCHLSTLEEGGFVKRVYERYELGIYLATIRASLKRSRELTKASADKDLDLINNC